jgi:hypothetical protein
MKWINWAAENFSQTTYPTNRTVKAYIVHLEAYFAEGIIKEIIKNIIILFSVNTRKVSLKKTITIKMENSSIIIIIRYYVYYYKSKAIL